MRQSWRKAVGYGAVLTVLGSAVGYGAYQRRLRENRAISPADFHSAQGSAFQGIVQLNDRQLREKAQQGLELYRYQTCPYCGTVKAFLDYLSIPHRVVEVDPMLKTEIKAHGYSKVPQLKFADGTVVVDSDEITNLFASKTGLKSSPEVDRWRQWARNQLSRYIVVVLNQTLLDSVRAYNYIDSVKEVPLWSKWLLKGVGGPVMYLVAELKTKKTLQREYGLGPQDDAKATMLAQLDGWVDSFGKGQAFHGGKTADMADLDVYGILLSARHMPLWADLQRESRAGPWMDAMEAVLAKNRRELP
eukprot:EG_transcript_19995